MKQTKYAGEVVAGDIVRYHETSTGSYVRAVVRSKEYMYSFSGHPEDVHLELAVGDIIETVTWPRFMLVWVEVPEEKDSNQEDKEEETEDMAYEEEETQENTALDIVRDTATEVMKTAAAVAAVDTAINAGRKGLRAFLKGCGVSKEWLDSKTGKLAVRIAAPTIILGVVFVAPIGKEKRQVMLKHVRNVLISKAAGILGKEFQGAIEPIVGIGGALLSGDSE